MKHYHIIGIAGVGFAPIAKMLQELGHKVTGSDLNVFDPMLTFLNTNNIEWYDGYDANRVDNADIIVLGGGPLMQNSNNPEYLRAKELNKPILTFPNILNEYVATNDSIVVTGTYGKTTTSGMFAWALDNANVNPRFYIGGQPIHYSSGLRLLDSKYTVFEGDEFAACYSYDNEPKFLYYKPKYTVITAAQWDHLNLYPTKESYIDAFRKLINETIKNNGLVLMSATGENNDILYQEYKDRVKIYSYSIEGKECKFKSDNHYEEKHIQIDSKGYSFEVYKNDICLGSFTSILTGKHNIENALAVISMSEILGFDLEGIKNGIATYQGVKRRLQIRGVNSKGTTIIDDFAHSAVKAKASLESLRERYQNEKIIVVFDPHASSLSDRKSLDWYPHTFDMADLVIIPKVSVKKSTPKENRVYGLDIVNAIKTTQPNVEYIPLDQDIISKLQSESDKNTVVVFMSSAGWRGILENILNF